MTQFLLNTRVLKFSSWPIVLHASSPTVRGVKGLILSISRLMDVSVFSDRVIGSFSKILFVVL